MSRKAQILQLLESAPGDAFLTFALAKEFEAEGDDATALSHYQGLTETHPDYPGTYYHLGKTLERLGRTEDALAVYDRGIEITERLGEKHHMRELMGARVEVEE